ncbi:MAG: hypothetical protein AA908_10440 [Chlorobi bacterium NICIL-2]|nr:MAG: hypothetical protein AA908_10440 [Chlorobi bacterium NICIL-2]
MNAKHQFFNLLRGKDLLFHLPIGVLTDGLQGFLQDILTNIHEVDLKSILSEYMRDTISHGTRSNNGYMFHKRLVLEKQY